MSSDPRPLTGEPLSIDLLNTRWIDGGRMHDLLDSADGLATWLAGRPELRTRAVRPDEPTRQALLRVRAALAEVIGSPADAAARARLNAALDHGRIRLVLTEDGPAQQPETDDPAWLPAWTAAQDYLRLLADRPARIRGCANPECVLHFYDTSKNGTRRWCSMAACGNRAKSSRHYARHRTA
ncbi:CGNR zinc finger domain-containing protein [Actinoallomurus spadix]|uniref:CGNR zinc finger domain-containing protein n=1 Tax=Actinoallomurus spadix TaxID=79912 RepID=A0ABN0VPD4_9ACTN|nr:CGNR zinc finger domain-containing protein [Actinoallomurus spadix]MCO5991225.1 CGNR zinc finger domain-containing protein [Actinoallomurus spadix]